MLRIRPRIIIISDFFHTKYHAIKIKYCIRDFDAFGRPSISDILKPPCDTCVVTEPVGCCYIDSGSCRRCFYRTSRGLGSLRSAPPLTPPSPPPLTLVDFSFVIFCFPRTGRFSAQCMYFFFRHSPQFMKMRVG